MRVDNDMASINCLHKAAGIGNGFVTNWNAGHSEISAGLTNTDAGNRSVSAPMEILCGHEAN